MSRIIPLSLLCAGLPLALTPGSPAQVPAPTPPAAVTVAAATPAVAVVREFLADRAAGKFAAAYALLSVGLPKFMSAEQFAAGVSMSVSASRQMPAQAFGMYALFADTHSTLGYTFTLVGPDPADPNSVLVRAQPRSGAVGVPAATLRLVTTADPTAHARRVDIYGSLERTAPEEFAKARRASSQSNMKQIALGIIQYTQDNDEHLPDADKWVDEIMPYVKSEPLFHDPSAPPGEKWSYAFNRTLSRTPVAQLDSPASTVMLFESSKGTKNASDTGESVPNPGRHSGGTDYALADGHVKWLADGTKLSYTLSGK